VHVQRGWQDIFDCAACKVCRGSVSKKSKLCMQLCMCSRGSVSKKSKLCMQLCMCSRGSVRKKGKLRVELCMNSRGVCDITHVHIHTCTHRA
jgi:hypothetical protein